MATGWTIERRKRQSELIYQWRPWEKSTGPKSSEGKRRSAMRAMNTGEYSAETRELRAIIAAQGRLLRDVKNRASIG